MNQSDRDHIRVEIGYITERVLFLNRTARSERTKNLLAEILMAVSSIYGIVEHSKRRVE